MVQDRIVSCITYVNKYSLHAVIREITDSCSVAICAYFKIFTTTGVHNRNQDLILCVKIGVYMFFWYIVGPDYL